MSKWQKLELNLIFVFLFVMGFYSHTIYGWILVSALFLTVCVLVTSYRLLLEEKEVEPEIDIIDQDLVKENKGLKSRIDCLNNNAVKTETTNAGLVSENSRLHTEVTAYIKKNGSLQNQIEHLTKELDNMNEQAHNL